MSVGCCIDFCCLKCENNLFLLPSRNNNNKINIFHSILVDGWRCVWKFYFSLLYFHSIQFWMTKPKRGHTENPFIYSKRISFQIFIPFSVVRCLIIHNLENLIISNERCSGKNIKQISQSPLTNNPTNNKREMKETLTTESESLWSWIQRTEWTVNSECYYY